MYRINIFLIAVLAALASCAPARFVEPLKKGQQVITGNFGGPVAKIPGIGAIPIPFTAVGYGYGVTNKTTIFGNVHTTSSHLELVKQTSVSRKASGKMTKWASVRKEP